MIPPDVNGEFVAHMEEVLETYEKAYDPDGPVVCMDEQPVQLIAENRVPIPAIQSTPSALTTNTNERDGHHLHVRRAAVRLPAKRRCDHTAPKNGGAPDLSNTL